MLSTWLDFGGILLETLFLSNFLWKFRMCFFKVKLYWTYLRNGWSDWCETKRRCIGWILGELCDLPLWPHPWPWPCSFKVKVWNRLIWGMGWGVGGVWLTWIERDHDCDLWVTMVGWVDVPYSDWGDFKRRRAVDISSFGSVPVHFTPILQGYFPGTWAILGLSTGAILGLPQCQWRNPEGYGWKSRMKICSYKHSKAKHNTTIHIFYGTYWSRGNASCFTKNL